MRIVFFVHRYWPVVGGVEKYVHQLARALRALGHEVTVVAGDTRGDLAERGTVDGVEVHRFPAYRSPLRARLWLWRHRRLFQRADVIQVSNTHMLEYFWRTFGPLIDRRRVFLTRHGMSSHFPVPSVNKARARRALRLAAAVVHDGCFIEKWLGVKPDLCPDQGLYPTADALSEWPEPPPASAAFIGRLEPDSGIDVYLDGMAILAQRYERPVTLHVYGDGLRADELRQRVKRERLPVMFHGAVPDAQDRLFDAAFAFLDGRMAIQEAMARRRLVFAAYANPLKRDYVCGEPFSPWLVPVSSGAELAERLTHYINHPEAQARMVREAYEHVRRLSWPRTAAAYVRLWQARLAQPVARCNRIEFLRLIAELNLEPLGTPAVGRFAADDGGNWEAAGTPSRPPAGWRSDALRAAGV